MDQQQSFAYPYTMPLYQVHVWVSKALVQIKKGLTHQVTTAKIN